MSSKTEEEDESEAGKNQEAQKRGEKGVEGKETTATHEMAGPSGATGHETQE